MVAWKSDELILVGEAIRQNGWRGIRASSDIAKALSGALRTAQIHPGEVLPDDFRSPNSIQRKSYDLVSAAPGYVGVPTRGGKLDGVLMAQFLADPYGMAERASVIWALLDAGESLPNSDENSIEPDAQIGAIEGGLIAVVAKRRERDGGLRKRKLAAVQRAGRNIACEVCELDFGAMYGTRGVGYIEVHHINPLHVTGPTETALGDLALLCANCHRMCHRGNWITPVQLAAFMPAT